MSGSVTLQEYWNLRAPNYDIVDVFGRSLIKAYMEKLGIHPRSVVEIGTGKGELLHLFQSVPRVVGLDFSEKMLEYAQRRITNHGWTNVELKLLDLTRGHLDEKFDLLVGRTVLMHIPPVSLEPKLNIEAAVENVSAMSDTLILLELWDIYPERKLAPHNWIHDYHRLFEDRGFRILEAYQRPDMNQVVFVFKRR